MAQKRYNIIPTFKFEFFRVISWKNLLFMILLLAVSLYFTEKGVANYRNFLDYKKDFKNIEEQKFDSFINYEQYARVGIRLIFEPSPLSVFFGNSDFVQNMEANTSSADIVNIYNPRKGPNVFLHRELLIDIGQIMDVLVTLFMMYMGVITIKSRDALWLSARLIFKNIFLRLMILNIYVIILLASVYLYALLRGISFSEIDNNNFLFFVIYSVFFLSLFFLAGNVIAAIHKYKKQSLLSMFVIWIVIIFFLPALNKTQLDKELRDIPSSEKLNLDKLKVLLKAEKEGNELIQKILSKNKNITLKEVKEIMNELNKNYMNNGYIDNKQKEDKFRDKVTDLVKNYESGKLFSPVDYYIFLSHEISSKGYTQYVDFIDYVLILKDRFIRFYSHKRYESDDKELENFIKDGENIYKAQSRLPRTFWKGFVIILFYIILLFPVYLKMNRRKEEKIEKLGFKAIPDSNKFLFLLTSGEKKVDLIKGLSQGGDAAVLKIPSEQTFKENISLKHFLDYICHVQKLDEKKLTSYLKHFDFKKEDLEARLSRLSFEIQKTITCSIILARDKETLVIDDFLKGTSENFEKKFLDLIDLYLLQGKKVVYVSDRVFLPAATSKLYKFDKKGYRPYILNPKKISLR